MLFTLIFSEKMALSLNEYITIAIESVFCAEEVILFLYRRFIGDNFSQSNSTVILMGIQRFLLPFILHNSVVPRYLLSQIWI